MTAPFWDNPMVSEVKAKPAVPPQALVDTLEVGGTPLVTRKDLSKYGVNEELWICLHNLKISQECFFFGAILKNRRVLREQVDFFLGVGNDDGFYRQALCPVDQNSGMEHH